MARSIELARIFYTVEAETKGLDGQLKSAERSFGRTADFIKANPVAAAGALTTALIVVGTKATEMAADVDAAVRAIGASLPSATGRIDDLKDAAKDLSVQFGVSQVEIVGAMQSIAKKGVDSVDDLIAATRAVQVAVKATGESTETVIGLLDTTLDSFGLSAKDSERILAKLFATVQGKTSFAELAETFTKIAPLAQQSKLGFDVLAAATVTLINRGDTAKEAFKALNTTFKDTGAEGLKALAEESKPATDGLEALNAAAEANNNTLQSLNARLKEGFNAALIDLGNVILPIVVKQMQGLVGLIALLDGTTKKIKDGGALATIESLSGSLNKLTTDASKTDAFKRLGAAMVELSNGPGAHLAGTFYAISNADFTKVSGPGLTALKKGLEAAAASGKLAKIETVQVKEALGKLNTEIAKRGPAQLAGDVKSAGEAASGAAPPIIALTGAQRSHAAALQKKAEAERLAKQVAEQALAVTIAATTEIATKYRPAIEKVIDTQKRLRTELDQIFDAEDKLKNREQARAEHHQEIARQVEQAARGLIGVGQAAGIWSQETANTLQNVVSIASTVEGILSNPGGIDLASTVSIIGAAASILSGIFGESAASRERKEIVKKNTEALRETADQIGNLLSISSPGAVFANASQALKQLFTKAGLAEVGDTKQGVFAGINTGKLAGFLKDFGLRLSDLDSLAQDFGITIRNKSGTFLAQGLEDLLTVLATEGDEFSTFGETFQDQMEKIRIGLETGIIKPTEEFGAILQGLGGVRGGAPSAITGALAGLDVSTAGGRAAATAALQDLVRNVSTLSPEQFGGLTPKQFLDVLAKLIGILQSDQAITGATLGADAPTAAITTSLDAGFGDLVTVGDVTNDYLAEIVANTAAFRPIAAPTLPASLGGGATATGLGAGFSVGTININLTGIDPNNAAAVGDAAAEAVYRALNERFARGVLDERAALGDVRRS